KNATRYVAQVNQNIAPSNEEAIAPRADGSAAICARSALAGTRCAAEGTFGRSRPIGTAAASPRAPTRRSDARQVTESAIGPASGTPMIVAIVFAPMIVLIA